MAKPQQTFQIGLEKIAIFENEGERGKYLNAQVEGRRFEHAKDGWPNFHSYNAVQLAAHIALCQTVLSYMIEEAPSN